MRRKVGGQILRWMGGFALLVSALPAFAAPPTINCSDYAGLTARMAGCIRENVDQGALVFFTDIYPFLQNAIALVMTLAVIVYGVMLAYGAVEKVGRDTYIVLMKLACVVIFCNSSPLIRDEVTGAMDNAILAVTDYTPASGAVDSAGTDIGQSQCVQNMIIQKAATDPKVQIMRPWLGIDCLIDTVIGIHLQPTTTPAHDGTWINKQLDTTKNTQMSRSLLYIFFCGMQTSVLGLMLAIIGFFFIYGMIMLIIRCFFVYIAGYMGVTFLAIISPLIIPMVLFKETKQYFDKWAKMLISFALQPVIMLVFLIFSLTAMDLAVYSSKYSVYYNIAGDVSQAANFDMNKYLTTPTDGTSTCKPGTPADPGPPAVAAVAGNCIVTAESKPVLLVKADNPNPTPKTGRDAGGTFNQLLYAKCTPEDIKANPLLKAKCSFTYPISASIHKINWDVMESAHVPAITPVGNPGQAISRLVLSSVFFCLMVVFILNGILQVVPQIVGDLLGDLNQSPIIGGLGMGGLGRSSGKSFNPVTAMSNAVTNAFKGATTK